MLGCDNYDVEICHIKVICLVKCCRRFGAVCSFYIQILCSLELVKLQGYT